MLSLFTLKDVKAGSSMIPFAAPNEAVAIRDVQTYIRESRIPNPEDQELYRVGSYDPETMRLTPSDPNHILNCTSLIESTSET